jgi:6-phosphogluconolactonase
MLFLHACDHDYKRKEDAKSEKRAYGRISCFTVFLSGNNDAEEFSTTYRQEEAMNKRILAAVLTAAILLIPAVAVFAHGWGEGEAAGAVYAMTNADSGNQVVIFDRDDDGMLTMTGSISTGGMGSGTGLDPLGSQGALTLSNDHRWLVAVNAGSNEITAFRVRRDGLVFADKVDSGGVFPVSVTIFHNVVYVLNAGGSPNITGFKLSHNGKLIHLTKSTRWLGDGAFAQVGFDPEGETLVVTDKAGSRILVYSVNDDGLAGMNPVISPSNGVTPFGFIFDQRGHLLVVEATTNAVSSYKILPDDTLDVISGSVLNGQVAACWIAGNRRGDVYTTNPGTSSISAYQDRNRSLVLLNGVAGTGSTPLDLSITSDGRFLYALDPQIGTIDMFKIECDGSLTDLGTVSGGFSIFAQGIAAR